MWVMRHRQHINTDCVSDFSALMIGSTLLVQTASSAMAMPWPTPMHMVASASRSPVS